MPQVVLRERHESYDIDYKPGESPDLPFPYNRGIFPDCVRQIEILESDGVVTAYLHGGDAVEKVKPSEIEGILRFIKERLKKCQII